MAGVNKVILIGNLGKDPEIRYTPSGAAVCSFSLATSRQWKDKDGNKKEETDWHNISAFERLAELCMEYLEKGSKVFIEGRLKTDKYEKEGQIRYLTKIIANSVQFLDGKKQEEQVQDISSGLDDVPF